MNAPTRLPTLVVTRPLANGSRVQMAPSVQRVLTVFGVLSVLSGSAASPAHARVMAPEPVVVVVESEFRRTDAAAVREAIAGALDAPVLRLTDPGANRARDTLSISFSADGRHAHIYFRRASGDQAAVLVEVVAGRGADAEGRWIAEPAAAAVRTLDRWGDMTPASEVLDPWLLERVHPSAPGEIHLLPDLQDPFEGEPASDVNIAVDRYYYGSEVLNPWAHSSNPESAQRLSPPRPTPR